VSSSSDPIRAPPAAEKTEVRLKSERKGKSQHTFQKPTNTDGKKHYYTSPFAHLDKTSIADSVPAGNSCHP
jgi:hypothetical protein